MRNETEEINSEAATVLMEKTQEKKIRDKITVLKSSQLKRKHQVLKITQKMQK